jgi:tripartite-type tricarboxylate transporter receptor subunit TctC
MRKHIPAAISFVLGTVLVAAAHAQSWAPPGRQVTFVVPYAGGNITDIAARLVAAKLSENSAKPILVENRTGGASQIATNHVAKSEADGTTFLVEGPAFTTNPSLYTKLPYDSQKDLTPVVLVVTNPLVLVTASSKPYKTARDLIAQAKANANGITMGSGGNGVLSHMAQALTAVQTQSKIVHVPYRGGEPASVDTISGQIDCMWNNPSSAMPHIKSGRLRALAVSGKTRSPALPDVPALSELGYPEFEATNWFGIFAPSKVSPEIIRIVHAEVMKVLALPEVRERFARDGVQVGSLTQPEFVAFVRSEEKKWAKTIRANGIKPG